MRTKIRIYGVHLGYIDSETLNNFMKNHDDFNLWLKNKIYLDFNIVLKSKKDIEKLKTKVLEKHYENVAEWIRDEIRKELNG